MIGGIPIIWIILTWLVVFQWATSSLLAELSRLSMSVRTCQCHSVFCICAFCISVTVHFVFLLLCILYFCYCVFLYFVVCQCLLLGELSMLSTSVGTRCRRVFCIEEHYTKCMCVCAHQKMEIVKIIFTIQCSAQLADQRAKIFSCTTRNRGTFIKFWCSGLYIYKYKPGSWDVFGIWYFLCL